MNCRCCGQELTDDAGKCPFCGALQRAPASFAANREKKFSKGRAAALVCTLLLVSACLVALGYVLAQSMRRQAARETGIYDVGETATFGGVSVTLTSLSTSEGIEFEQPAGDSIYLLCSFTIRNNSKKALNIDPMTSFAAFSDGYPAVYSEEAAAVLGDRELLDGTVAPGETISGAVGFVVPDDWESFEVRFTPASPGLGEFVFFAEHA